MQEISQRSYPRLASKILDEFTVAICVVATAIKSTVALLSLPPRDTDCIAHAGEKGRGTGVTERVGTMMKNENSSV